MLDQFENHFQSSTELPGPFLNSPRPPVTQEEDGAFLAECSPDELWRMAWHKCAEGVTLPESLDAAETQRLKQHLEAEIKEKATEVWSRWLDSRSRHLTTSSDGGRDAIAKPVELDDRVPYLLEGYGPPTAETNRSALQSAWSRGYDLTCLPKYVVPGCHGKWGVGLFCCKCRLYVAWVQKNKEQASDRSYTISDDGGCLHFCGKDFSVSINSIINGQSNPEAERYDLDSVLECPGLDSAEFTISSFSSQMGSEPSMSGSGCSSIGGTSMNTCDFLLLQNDDCPETLYSLRQQQQISEFPPQHAWQILTPEKSKQQQQMQPMLLSQQQTQLHKMPLQQQEQQLEAKHPSPSRDRWVQPPKNGSMVLKVKSPPLPNWSHPPRDGSSSRPVVPPKVSTTALQMEVEDIRQGLLRNQQGPEIRVDESTTENLGGKIRESQRILGLSSEDPDQAWRTSESLSTQLREPRSGGSGGARKWLEESTNRSKSPPPPPPSQQPLVAHTKPAGVVVPPNWSQPATCSLGATSRKARTG